MNKTKLFNLAKIFSIVALFSAVALLLGGLIAFFITNADIFFNVWVMAVVFALCLLLLPILAFLFAKKNLSGKKFTILSAVLVAVSLGILIYIIVSALVVDFFQPITLSAVSKALLVAGAVVAVVGALLLLLSKKNGLSIALSAMLIVVMLVGIIWANTQGYNEFNDEILTSKTFLFDNGEKGYTTFRIPSLVALNKDKLNQTYEYDLDCDVLLAMSEGRINSSHDTGDIDMVYKTSCDGGKTWSELQVMFTYGVEIGKYGNPTVVLDDEGLINVTYLKASEKSGYDYDTYDAKFRLNADFSLTLCGEEVNLSYEKTDDTDTASGDGVRAHTLMVGPGKSIVLQLGEHKGRILVPSSSGGYSFVTYSDDGGKTWVQSKDAGTGNECEVAELPNGEIVMVSRAMTECTAVHNEQYQRLSYSNDGGETWYVKNENTTLKTPVCMASIAVKNNEILLTYPNSFLTRVNLALSVSSDGKTWSTYDIYNGASGYSCLTVTSDGRVFVLAEIGKVNYNETLFFAEINI